MWRTIFQWTLRIVAAVIMLQTLFFKFTAHPESVELFTIIGMEPWGRIGTGVMELGASLLILLPATTYLGSLLAIGLMSGAVFFHLTKIGINFGGDPTLFIYALIVLICSAVLLYMDRQKFQLFVPLLRARRQS